MDIFKELKRLSEDNVFVSFDMTSPNYDEYEYSYTIQYVTFEESMQKRPKISHYNSFRGAGVTYIGTYASPEAALIAGIDHADKHILPECITPTTNQP